jgi:oxygen-independent coproporphyrinogen-3 oxidase
VTASSNAAAEPRAAYIHVPFCRHRCGYCNFTLVAGRDDLIPAYLDALERELRQLGRPRPVDTLFFGGGTPTHLDGDHLRRILQVSLEWFPLIPGAEFSVEANPQDATAEKLATLAEFGVNRLSLGAQAFSARKLELLERDHRRDQIERAATMARKYFASVGIDLIFGVPGETQLEWSEDLRETIALRPDHVSTYGLTIEKGAAFYGRSLRGELTAVDEEFERHCFELAHDELASAGFEHYEVSNYARAGFRCRHNEAYWLGQSYFAAGPGAARFVDGRREVNHRSVVTYIRKLEAGLSPVAEAEQLPPDAAARERLVFGLRRLEGVNAADFLAATGFSIDQLVGHALPRFLDWGFLEWSGGQLRLTRSGVLVSDAIWPKFLVPFPG